MLQTKEQKKVLKEVLQNEVRPHVVALKDVVKESNKLLKAISEKEYPEHVATDLKPLIDGLKTLTEEVKKKEEYAYEIKIDANLKRRLTGKQGVRGARGLRGLQGKTGKDGVTPTVDIQSIVKQATPIKGVHYKDGEKGEKGKDGNTITAEEIRNKLESLKGKGKLKMSAIKGLEELLKKLENVLNKSFTGFTGGGNEGGGGGTGSGDVVGPASSTDNAIPRYDGTTGKLIQNSQVTVEDNGDLKNVNGVQFDITPTPTTPVEGLMQWNPTEDTIDVTAHGVTYQLGQELSPLFKNQTGATIPNGTPVMFAGSVGASGRIKIQKAIADGSLPAFYTIGMTTEDILNGDDGHVTWFGKIRGLDTTGTPYGETWVDGDVIYISPTVAGGLTKVKPNTPDLQIPVCAVVHAHATVGTYFVRPTWNNKLVDLDDINGTPVTTDGQFAVWDNTNQYFDFTKNINDYILLTQKGANNGVATLDAGGKVPVSQLPATAITNTFVVASQVAMLALTAETGDVAIRTDTSTTYILQGTDPTVLGDWVLLATPTDVVTSIFSRTGAVTAQSGDYNTSQVTENTNLYFTTARVLATALAGFTVAGTRTAIVAGDTVLGAFGKVQKYFNDLSALAFSGSASDLTGSKTSAFISDFATAVASLITGKSDVGHTHVSTNVTDFNEAVEDIIGTKVKAGSGINVTYNDTTGETTVTNTGGASANKGGISFGLARSSGLVVGDKFRTVVPYNANITGWVIATTDGSSKTITLDVKRATYTNVPTFTAIDGSEPILLTGAVKNENIAVTTWDAGFTEGDHVEVSVLTVTGTVTGVYGIINVTKTS